MLPFFCINVYATFNQFDLRFSAITIINFLPHPLRLPAWIVYLPTEARSLGVGVKAKPFNGVQITFQRNEAIQCRPEAITMNWQYHTH